MPSRRTVVSSAAAAGVTSLAGCLDDVRRVGGLDAVGDTTVESWSPQAGTWPLDRYDLAGTAHDPHASPPDDPRIAWAETVAPDPVSTLVVSDDSVAAAGSDRVALVSTDGAIRWQQSIGGEAGAWYDGVLYLAGTGRVAALTADGSAAWGAPTSLDGDGRGYGVVPTADGVYAGVHGRAVALDRDSGALRWTRSFPNGFGRNGVCVADGRVFHAGTSGLAAYASRPVDAATRHLGPRVVWSTTSAVPSFPSSPTVAGETLSVTESGSDPGGRVYAFSTADGSLQWRTEPLGRYGEAPAIAGDHGFVGVARGGDAEIGSVVALVLDDGAVAWRHDFPAESWVGDVVVGGDVVLAAARTSTGSDGQRGRVVALDPLAGETRWTVDFDAPVGSLAAVDDRVYVGGDGFVAALAPP
ncbi:outer membrane protein assembly factor BamB family protein [Salinigranum salinum]|uniref:outer membrane protein assembly factor BamB family protein n=1 Tax=Salinigranum salinum TaxID=1364937 RepID=UPI001864C658|nr:PQQ-binding-like beta-propeller repeat protein [Salinigranum salinum]